MTVAAIDPGAHGAIAFLDADGVLQHVIDMPAVVVTVGKSKRARVSTAVLADVLREWGCTHAFVESVGAMPGQGGASMFSFGKAAGIVEGVLAGLGVPTTFVTPVAWKRAMQVTKDKAACRQRAMQMFPLSAALFARAKDDGRAESCLLGIYGLRLLSGGNL